MDTSSETVFAKIIRRDIPAEIVYEDADTIAFLDHAPDQLGHTLVVPKKYARSIFDIDSEHFLTVMKTVHMIARHVKKAVGADGMKILINNEPAGGQLVMHVHVHLIPFFDSKTPATKETLSEVAKKIRDTF
ncbi:MAG: HIT family protein [Minisyncoccia bacterium]